MRASQVIYDRAGASIADAEISDFDFDKIFDGAAWFHTTGITPALSDKCCRTCGNRIKSCERQRALLPVLILITEKNYGARKKQEK